MKCRDIVVKGKAVATGLKGIAACELARVAAGFEQNHRVSSLCQSSSYCAPARAGSHHDVFAVELLGHYLSILVAEAAREECDVVY
jgi:hypothetical protein